MPKRGPVEQEVPDDVTDQKDPGLCSPRPKVAREMIFPEERERRFYATSETLREYRSDEHQQAADEVLEAIERYVRTIPPEQRLTRDQDNVFHVLLSDVMLDMLETAKLEQRSGSSLKMGLPVHSDRESEADVATVNIITRMKFDQLPGYLSQPTEAIPSTSGEVRLFDGEDSAKSEAVCKIPKRGPVEQEVSDEMTDQKDPGLCSSRPKAAREIISPEERERRLYAAIKTLREYRSEGCQQAADEVVEAVARYMRTISPEQRPIRDQTNKFQDCISDIMLDMLETAELEGGSGSVKMKLGLPVHSDREGEPDVATVNVITHVKDGMRRPFRVILDFMGDDVQVTAEVIGDPESGPASARKSEQVCEGLIAEDTRPPEHGKVIMPTYTAVVWEADDPCQTGPDETGPRPWSLIPESPQPSTSGIQRVEIPDVKMVTPGTSPRNINVGVNLVQRESVIGGDSQIISDRSD